MGIDPASQTGTTLRVLLRDPADLEAWNAFVDRYTPKVLAWCRQWHLQPADAQDVAQEVLYKMVRYLYRFPYDRAKGRFRAWLKTVTRHAWCDLQENRRRSGWGRGDADIHRLLDRQDAPASLAESLDEEFTREVYEEAKARVQLRVSRTTWQAFEMLAVQGCSGVQVAKHLRMRVAAVYVAKRRVQRMLAEETQKLEGSGQSESKRRQKGRLLWPNPSSLVSSNVWAKKEQSSSFLLHPLIRSERSP